MPLIPKFKKKDKSKGSGANTDTSTGGSSPGGASTGGVGSGIGGAGTGGAATGGASTGGAGTVNVTISGSSGVKGKSKGSGSSGEKQKPTTINISNVGGRTDAGSVASGDGPGALGTGGKGSGSGGGGGGAAPDEPKNFNKGGEIKKMKPSNPQALGVAYAVKRKPKKMAKGGAVNESAKYEERPMPEERDKDSKMVGRNSGNKSPGEDSWSDDPTVRQAQKPSQTKLSRPKLAGSDAFSVRYKSEIDDDLDRMNSEPPESDRAQAPKKYDEKGANRQGPEVSDMEHQHNNKRSAYEKEVERQYAEDVANANMKKVQSLARGGPVMEPKDSGNELEERDDERHMMDELSSTEHGEQPAKWRDELDADSYGNPVPDMEREHSNGRKPYAQGGPIDRDEKWSAVRSSGGHGTIFIKDAEGGEVPDIDLDEQEDERHSSIAAAIMAKKDRESRMDSGSFDEDRAERMAEGGEVDLSRNADEDANEEDQLSFNALKKENYSESEGLEQLDSPDDSNEHGDEIDSDRHDMISKIRSKMKSRRQF